MQADLPVRESTDKEKGDSFHWSYRRLLESPCSRELHQKHLRSYQLQQPFFLSFPDCYVKVLTPYLVSQYNFTS